jgi:hypothetical protein
VASTARMPEAYLVSSAASRLIVQAGHLVVLMETLCSAL